MNQPANKHREPPAWFIVATLVLCAIVVLAVVAGFVWLIAR